MKKLFTRFGCWLLLVVLLPTLAQAQAPAAKAQQYLLQHAQQLGLQLADVQNPAVTDAYTDEPAGITHIYLRQQYQGLQVLGTETGLHFDAQGALLTHTGRFVADIARKAPAATAALSGTEATLAAARKLHLSPSSLQTAPATQSRSARLTLLDAALSTEEIPVDLAYALQADGSVKLTWQVVLHPPKGLEQWRLLVDATTGRVLQQHDRNTHEQFLPPTAMAAEELTTPPATRSRTAATDPVYNVFAIPMEAPSFGARTTVRNPADAQASPYGWHDTNGVAGAEFTTTRGNNVQAYTVINNASYYTDGGANLAFDKPYDIQKNLEDNRDAGLVNLFYMNNIMHDIFYYYGFQEINGNFQTKNYTAKGKGADQVRARVEQDLTKAYNASFSITAEGSAPTMMMYLWPAPQSVSVLVTSPSSIAASYAAVEGAIGPALTAGSPVKGNLVLVNDGSTSPTLSCTGKLTNAAEIKGNIAVIDRGSCTFVEKIAAAQAAGAIAVLMINNEPETLLTMSGDEALAIPAVIITMEAGALIKEKLRAKEPVTVELRKVLKAYADRDGAFDNAIIAHEYTHGISNRLTGGATSVDCLQNVETMGEGWSDFFSLWLTTKAGDTGATPRPVGTYVMGQATNGSGIRAKPYSTDMAVNDYTYAIIGKPYTETHDVGEVWATVLWDLNWAMIERYGYSTDLYRGTGGNNKAMQLVMQALKLQPCNPGFLDGRDAILTADNALYKSANQDLIWRVFARRGMGTDAVQGRSASVTDNKAGFALPATLATKNALSATAVEVYPNPANDVLTVRTFGLSAAPVQVEVLSVVGSLLRTVSVPAAQAQAGTTLDLSQLAGGVYMVRVTTPQGTLTKKVMVRH